MRELAKKYEKECAGRRHPVDAHGSNGRGTGARRPAPRPAKSRLPRPDRLLRRPAGGRLCPHCGRTGSRCPSSRLVVNDRVPVRNLSLATSGRIYRGDIRNWKALGGPDLPVLLVSRDANSGTREVFQRRVLGHNEPAQSSRDCATKDDAAARVMRCELDSTDQVLATVGRLDGAIGYSELRSGTALKGAHPLALDCTVAVRRRRSAPAPTRTARSSTPTPTASPPADSLTSSFLGYLSRGNGQDVIRTHGHLPCATPEGLRICGEE